MFLVCHDNIIETPFYLNDQEILQGGMVLKKL